MPSADKIRNIAANDVASSVWADRFQERSLQAPFTLAGGTATALEGGFATWAQTLGADSEQQGPGAWSRMGCTKTGGAGVAAGDILILDDTIDWRSRFLEVNYFVTTDATTMPGGASAHLFGQTALVTHATNAANWPLYTNGGATNLGTGSNPAAGQPPNIGPGGTTAGQFFKALTTVNVLTLYVEGKTPFRLGLYNAAAVPLYVAISSLRVSVKDGRF